MRSPADLFQSALSALDLYHPATSIKSEVIDDPDDIAVQQGQTAATVGRAIYEVRISDLYTVEQTVLADLAQTSMWHVFIERQYRTPSNWQAATADAEAEHCREDKTHLR